MKKNLLIAAVLLAFILQNEVYSLFLLAVWGTKKVAWVLTQAAEGGAL